jgi:CBS domain-containing protein
MQTTNLLEMTASDLMTRNVVRLTAEMLLWQAADVLLKNQIGGAPVVDREGKCVGVLSASDFIRSALQPEHMPTAASAPLPVTCGFQLKHRIDNGHEVTLCTLPPGVCSAQVEQKGPKGQRLITCSQPHSVLADWQVVNVEKSPAHEVRHFMTPDPVTVSPETPLRVLARHMIDAHVHRVVVVDEEARPIGIVSGTDVLAAVAYSGGEQGRFNGQCAGVR